MSNFDLISMGIKNLLRRKTRTILTILGVIIGTSSIVVMLSLGIGMNLTFQNQLEQMGSLNVIDVSSGGYMMEESAPSSTDQVVLDDQTLTEIEGIEHVDAALAIKRIYAELYAGRYKTDVSIIGVDVDKLSEFNIELSEGRFPISTGKNEIIFGKYITEQFFNPKAKDPWAEQVEVDLMNTKLTLKINDYSMDQSTNRVEKGTVLNAVGMIKESQSESDWSAYMDIDALDMIQNDKRSKTRVRSRDERLDKYDSFKVKVDEIKNVAEVQEQIKGMGFQAWSLSDILDSMKKTSAGIQIVLGSIGAVSLFVAALGITNTMIMSIYERTKEIGVMKVIGAQLKDIKRLFLFEAGLIGFFGGLFGILMSLGISKLINIVGGGFAGDMMGADVQISVIPFWLMLLAISFSSLVGIISGYYPARRAMRLSALEAIRGE